MSEQAGPIEIEVLHEIYVDGGIARYIEEFNKLGYSTKMSCSGMRGDGHYYLNGNRPYISFKRPRDFFLCHSEYFKSLASCFIKLNELEEQKYPNNPKNRIFWSLAFQPCNIKNLSNLVGMTSYLPHSLKDEIIFDKLEELLHLLRNMDYFNKLYETTLEMGEEIIIVL